MPADNIGGDVSDSSSCRILVVSALLERAADLLLQIQTLSTSISSKRRSQISSNPSPPPIDVSNLTNSSRIPWTISNKYYTAPVHYLVHTVNGLAPYLLKDVPAVIFVWKDGEDYRHHILRIAQDIGGSQPEIALAVRLPAKSGASSADEDEDISEVDDFLSSNGFEFIDVAASDGDANVEDNMGFSERIPSLPRVLDALGTIMWPSMQSSGPSSTSKTHAQEQALLDWSQSGSFDLNEEDMIVTGSASVIGPAQQLRVQKQLDELARWLEEDEVERQRRAKEDPWQSTDAEADEMVGSPTDIEVPESFPTNGFDDDFTVFVSAPPVEPTPLNIPPSNTFGSSEDSSDADALTPLRSAPMYHSLGSQSDLGDMSKDMDEVEADEDDEDTDEDFPTKVEIRESAVKIFGPFEDAPDLPETFSFSDSGEDLAPFDLTRVLGALEGIKAEIAGMENEDERRRAAAKVALGLVHGLERAPAPTS